MTVRNTIDSSDNIDTTDLNVAPADFVVAITNVKSFYQRLGTVGEEWYYCSIVKMGD